MASLKLSLDSRRPYKDGRFPVIIRLTHNTQSTSILTQVKLFKAEWDDSKARVTKFHGDSKSLNLSLKNKLLGLEKKALELSSEASNWSVIDMKEALLNERKSTQITFKDFAQREIAILKTQGKYGNAMAYETAVNRLSKFCGEATLLNKINYVLITEFDTHLITEKVARNSIACYMREIRAILNKAIKKDLLDGASYPFRKYIIKGERTVSRAILKADLEKFRQHPLKAGTELWHSRNIFFLIFNLIGISFIDLALLTKNSIQNNRIVYRRRKTGKMYSIKITTEAESLFALYKSDSSKYLLSKFNLDDVPKENEIEIIHYRLKSCNHYLKKLGKELKLPICLTTYVARYSWANIAKASGFSKDLIAESLGHEYGNSITGIYLENYGDSVIDDANEKVTAFSTELKIE
jgi:integrase/recombinase XerD